MRYCLLVWIFLFTASATGAQPVFTARADRSRITMGEPVKIWLEAKLPYQAAVKWCTVPSVIGTFEVIEMNKPDTVSRSGLINISQQLLITGYDSGRWPIAPFTIFIGELPIKTDTLFITVEPVKLIGNDYRPLKEIQKVPARESNYWPWKLFLIGLIVALLALYVFKKRKGPRQVVSLQEGASERARKRLAKLQQTIPVAPQQQIGFYTELMDIFRDYLSESKGIYSKQKTSAQLLEELKQRTELGSCYTNLAIVLRRCDFVKFAKYIAPDEEQGNSIHILFNAISQMDKVA